MEYTLCSVRGKTAILQSDQEEKGQPVIFYQYLS